MNLNIKLGDVFETDIEGAALAHCVPADKKGRGGFVSQVIKHTHDDSWLELYHSSDIRTGDAWVYDLEYNLSTNIDIIYNLVTKDSVYDIVDLANLKSALVTLRQKLLEAGETKVVMPAIGSGIDKADWKDVEIIILDVFKDTGIDITVYHYTEPE